MSWKGYCPFGVALGPPEGDDARPQEKAYRFGAQGSRCCQEKLTMTWFCFRRRAGLAWLDYAQSMLEDARDTSRGFLCSEGVLDFELLGTCRAPSSRVIMRTTIEYQYPVPEIQSDNRLFLSSKRTADIQQSLRVSATSAVLAATMASAQAPGGATRGTISDPSGASVSGAEITIEE